MKKYNSDYEKLSAYLDGELPLSEKNELEQKISLSPDLKKKLLELKKIKELTSTAYKNLPEAPYLETRIMASLKQVENKSSFIRRNWIPVFGLVAVTIALMVILKFNPGIVNRIVEEQSTNLAAFYKENLKPLLYASNLSNEDIFNFAFYKELPLDNNNEQFLQIGNDSGVEFFEIKRSSYNIQENNYEKFVNALNLDDKQKIQIDSILRYYAGELQAQVLVNDRNAVAINPNLWNYNKAIAADLVQFASTINEPELRKIIPQSDKFLHTEAMVRMVDEVKSNDENNYIFLTPDTIFSSWIDVDSREMKEELRKAREEIRIASREFAEHTKEFNRANIVVKIDSLRNIKKKNFKKEKFDVFIGDNNYRVEIQGIEIPEIPVPDMDSISAHVEKIMQSVHVYTTNSPKNPSKLSKRYNLQYGFRDSLNKVIVTPEIPDLDSLMNFNYNYFQENEKDIDSVLSLYMPQFKFRHDSLTNYFKMYGDSARYQYDSELRNQLEEIEIEMKKFREEMQNLRKDLNKDTNKQNKSKTIKKPVEI